MFIYVTYEKEEEVHYCYHEKGEQDHIQVVEVSTRKVYGLLLYVHSSLITVRNCDITGLLSNRLRRPKYYTMRTIICGDKKN